MDKENWLSSLMNRAVGVGGVRPKIDMKLTGQNPAIAALEALPDKVAMRVMRFAMKKSLVPGIAAARSAAEGRQTTGARKGPHLYETTISKVKGYRNNQTIYGMVGYSAPHGWLAEHGHRMVVGGTVARTNKLRRDYGKANRAASKEDTGAGRVVGQVQPHPILEPAYRGVSASMEAIFVSELKKATGRAIARIAREAGVK